jgi:Flp pilus assembly protein TadD
MSALSKQLGLAFGIASAALLASCAVAPKPTTQELAMISDASRPILPASAAERAQIEQHDLLTQAKFWTKEYDKNPNEYEVALKYARVLRAIGSSPRSSEVAAQALAMKPGDPELSMIFAQAALDQGKPEDAAQALARAEREAQNDWRMLSIIGVTMDSLDQHSGAQDYYKRAIVLSPDNPKILSNLALSYALDGKPTLAEETLRHAIQLPDADNRIKQNLIMVLGVQGKFEEAEKIAGPETPKMLVEANKDYFRSMLTPSRTWSNLRGAQ